MRTIIASLVLFAACSRENVQWGDVSYSPRPLPSQVALGSASPSPSACPVSVRAIRAGKDLLAVWWSVRPDSGAVLFVARSRDEGKSWTSPVVADSLDLSVSGCDRPAPAIAADP